MAERDRRFCVRCTGKGTDLHHRRKRSVRDEHQHCPCNLVTLCRTCHSWAHANPTLSGEQGLIVASWIDEPANALTKQWWGWIRLECDGGSQWVTA